MENILKENEIVNTDKAIISKLAFKPTSKSKDVIKAVDNIHSINQAKPKSIIELALYNKDIEDNLNPFKDEPTAKEIEQELKIQKQVEANILKDKVKKATKEELAKINPVSSKREMTAPPTIESIYLDRTLADNKTLYIDDYRRDVGNIYKWTSEYWEVQNPDDVRAEITNWLKNNHNTELSSRNVNSIFNVFYFKMEAFNKVNTNNLYIPTKTHWLVVDQTTGAIEAIKPNKSIPLTYQINIIIKQAGPYTPKETAVDSLFSKFINSSLPELDKQAVMQEFSGYCLTSCTKAHKFLFMKGGGGNGKSVHIAIMSTLIPNSVSVRMDTIGLYNDNLVDKNVIFTTETHKGGFNEELFKAATAGDKVEIRGIRKDKQSIKLIAKWILVGNNDFRIEDFSSGIARRMIIINWNESFTNSKDIVRNLEQRIVDEELDIVLDWCLIGLQRLISNKLEFTRCEESEKALFDFLNHADKVRMFANDYQYEYSPEHKHFITKENLYNKFLDYVLKNGYEKLNAVNFWIRMKNIYPEIEKDIKSDIKRDGKRVVFLKPKLQEA
ncbi:DNA primase family protein [Methylovorus glucosotrophus]|uniref:ATPase-like protein n=1 Tax=Methylovorus glucosotrophus (strain SIP3-4) TaxID=582744 RepID=C6X7Y3_METGS|nr:DUF5906 domain-containing protein [Methylovorus glucosotrophus]ACT51310.1 ATPase-like protein [Methylovorus glucosotrophus SIP3-4]